jgi:hypothetical protein
VHDGSAAIIADQAARFIPSACCLFAQLGQFDQVIRTKLPRTCRQDRNCFCTKTTIFC